MLGHNHNKELADIKHKQSTSTLMRVSWHVGVKLLIVSRELR